MKLILIRHADASNEEPRALTEGGRRQHTHVADGGLSLEVKKSGVIGIQTKGHPARGNGTLLFVFRPDELIRF
jgi:phosphohistidine phosphatase SixA